MYSNIITNGICLDVFGTNSIAAFMFVQKSASYQTFIGYPLIVPTCFNDFYISGKCILMTNELPDYDELMCISFDTKKEHVSHKRSRLYPKGSFRLYDTLFIGVGYFPQSVTILPYPTEKEILDEIESATILPPSGCKCANCASSRALISPAHDCLICSGSSAI
jgi:hypothetical protein